MKLLRPLLALVPLIAAAQGPDLAVAFQRRQLPNGLTAILVHRPGAPGVSVRLAAKVGSAEDPQGQSGLLAVCARALAPALPAAPAPSDPALLEELDQRWEALLAERRFRGLEEARAAYTLSKPTADPAREASLRSAYGAALARAQAPAEGGPADLLEIGGAHTLWGRDLPPDELAAWCQAMAGGLRSLELRGFHAHREALANARPRPGLERLEGLLRQEAYPAGAVARPVLGWSAETALLRRTDARAFAARAFAPGNLALLMVGDLRWADVDGILAATFGALEPREALEPALHLEPLAAADRRVFHDMDDTAAYMVAWRVPGLGHPDHPALEVAAGLLGGGRTGRLVTRLLEGPGLARAAGVSLGRSGRADGNLFTAWAEARGDRTPSELAQPLGGEIDRLRSQAPGADQVARVLARARSERARELENPSRLATAFARAWAATGDEASYVLALERLAAVRPEDVQRAVKAHLREKGGVQAIGVRPRRAVLGDDTLEGDIAELLTKLVQRQYPNDNMKVGDEVRGQLDQILSLSVEQQRQIRDELRKKVGEALPAKEKQP